MQAILDFAGVMIVVGFLSVVFGMIFALINMVFISLTGYSLVPTIKSKKDKDA